MKKKKYTIVNIANLSGFSKATVSKVIRNKPYVKKSTKEKIQNIIKEIGYHPDEIARSLVSKKNMNFIGLIISDINNSFFSEVALGVESEAKKRGYNVILCNTNYLEEEEKKYIDILIRNRATGLLLATPTLDDNNIKELLARKYPFVLITRKIKGLDSNIVSVNHYKSAKMAVNYLIKKGHKKIAHFTVEENTIGVVNRLKGYEAALKENDIKFNKNFIFKNRISKIECGYKLAQKLLASADRPTAIFASDDLLAIGALDCFLEKGYKVPDDLSIIGYDNIKITSLKSINLTTVNQPKFEMGVKSVEILFEQINGKEDFKAIKYYFKAKIVERGSVLDIS
ncbi:HTH-type transcriptional regulator DegA [subsurface metagenome]